MNMMANVAARNRPRSRRRRQRRRHRARHPEQGPGEHVPGQGAAYPWHEKPSESYWARLATPMAGAERGLVLIPEVGDEVLVAFEREDLRFPYVLGGAVERPGQAAERSTTTARTTSASSSRARSTTCCSTTARRASWSSLHEKGRKVTVRRQRHRHAGREGQHRQDRQQQRRDHDRGESAASRSRPRRSRIEATGTLDVKASATLNVRGALVNIN